MYFVMENDMLSWKGKTIQASFQGSKNDCQPHWWDCVPLVRYPSPFIFQVDPSTPAPDNYYTGTILNLFSRRLIDILREFDVDFETFPVNLIDKSGNNQDFKGFFLFHILIKCSLKSIRHRDEHGHVTSVKSEHPMFRVEKHENLLIAHNDVRDVLENAGITGFKYRPFK